MKKTLIQALLVIAASAGVIVSLASADPIKGEKIVQRAIHDDCKYPATTIASKLSVEKWEEIISSGKLEEEISKLCDRKIPLKPFRPKYVKHVAEFLEHYANNSGAIPA